VSGAPTRLVKRVVSGFMLNGSRVNRVVNGSYRVTRFASPLMNLGKGGGQYDCVMKHWSKASNLESTAGA
jgi:hypothetical protein